MDEEIKTRYIRCFRERKNMFWIILVPFTVVFTQIVYQMSVDEGFPFCSFYLFIYILISILYSLFPCQILLHSLCL